MEIMSSSAVAPVATGDMMEATGDQTARERPRLYREILLIALCYSAYSLVRNLVPTTHTKALRLGHQILDLERFLHLDPERWVTHLFIQVHWLGVLGNYYYSTLPFFVTPAVLA